MPTGVGLVTEPGHDRRHDHPHALHLLGSAGLDLAHALPDRRPAGGVQAGVFILAVFARVSTGIAAAGLQPASGRER